MELNALEKDFDRDVLDYCNAIADGAIPAGLYTRKSIERFVDDYAVKQKEADYPYAFVPEHANEAIRFAESLFIPDIDSKLKLLPWMKFIYYNLYGWVHKDDTTKRRFRSGYIECARKNSKTTSLLFPPILYDFTHTKSAESFFVSKSKIQVEKSFQEMKLIIQESFTVNKRKTVMTESGIRKGGSFIKFFSSGSRDVDQYKNSCSVIDEYHDYDNKGEKVVTAFRYGSRARDNSLVLIITSAGLNVSGPCYAENEKARKILNGIVTDDTYFTVIYAYDEDDDWKDPENFIKANPSLGPIVTREVLEIDLTDALITPSHQADFKSKTCGIWNTGGSVSWIPLDRWEALEQPEINWDDFKKTPCFGSFDLSAIGDFTAYTLCFNMDDKYYFKHRFYIPLETVRERYKKENIGITDWIERGVVTAIPGPVIDYSVVFEDVKQDKDRFDIQDIAYDTWNSRELVKMIENELPALTIIPYEQNLKRLSNPTKAYEKLVYEKKVVDPNPVMKWMIGNVTVKPDSNGNYKPMKDFKSSNKKIDGVITSIISLDRCMSTENTSLSFDEILALF
jgi:phage terminase large subunit-like protein